MGEKREIGSHKMKLVQLSLSFPKKGQLFYQHFVSEYVHMTGKMNSYRFEILNRRESKFCSHDVSIWLDMGRHFILGSVYMIFYHTK